jgi:N-acetylmuramoyl-L-alanine amidase
VFPFLCKKNLGNKIAMRSVKTLTKQFLRYGFLGFAAIGLISSDYETSKTDNDVDTNISYYNAKKLVNTTWKIKYTDCSTCADKADDIRFMDMGKGFIEKMPMRWFLKNDTVHLVTDIEGCRFDKVFLADETLMYGSQVCNGGKSANSFVARKKVEGETPQSNTPMVVAVPPAVTLPAVTNTAPAETAILNKNVLGIMDKTYMFKRGLQRRDDERRIDAIILHSSFCVNSRNDFDLYCVLGEYKRHGVAAHYLIDREGTIHRLVKEDDVAFHAGFGKMPDGNNKINTRSLGIELINSEEEGPNEYQYAALANLVRDIKTRYRIKYIKGHNQICPGRKSDPWKFSWRKFYDLIDPEQP